MLLCLQKLIVIVCQLQITTAKFKYHTKDDIYLFLAVRHVGPDLKGLGIPRTKLAYRGG